MNPISNQSHALREVAAVFLRFGFTAFGGPAAHIAMFHDELVKRRQWVTEEHFLDLLGATNLIPGPSSTEMTMHLGYVRAGWWGLIVAGLCFILPAALIVLGLAWLYVTFGALPAVGGILYGIKPVIIAVIVQALWSLFPKAAKNRRLIALGIAVLVLHFVGINELALLFGGALLYVATEQLRPTAVGLFGLPLLMQAPLSVPATLSLWQLFLVFLKFGAVIYGSGYVLLAFLQTDLVNTLGWLTQQQLLDAIAIGQITPGPVFTTATFIGYVLAGVPGAALATLGIFLPSFLLVAITNPLIPRLRQSRVLSAALDGVNAAAIGLMASVTLQLGVNAIVDLLTLALACGSAVLLIRYKINSTWLILIGGGIGFLVTQRLG